MGSDGSNLSDVLRDLADDQRQDRSDQTQPDTDQHEQHDPQEQAEPTQADAFDDDELASDQRPPAAGAAKNDRPDEPTHADADEPLLGEIDDEAGDAIAASPPKPAPASSPAPARRAAARSTSQRANDQLKSMSVPILITVGILLLMLGGWGTLVAQGSDIWLSDRPRADAVATAAMLVGYPLGAVLIAGAVFFIHQLRAARAPANNPRRRR